MQLARYFFIVFIFSVAIAMAGTFLVNKGLQRSGVDFYGKMNSSRENVDSTELLIVGSSRALKQLDTRIFDSVLNLHSYNYGLNAVSIKTCYNIISYALHFQKNVKFIVLNVDYNMFDMNIDPYKQAYYYPYENLIPATGVNEDKKSLVHKIKVFDVSLYDDYAKYAAIDGWLRPGRKVQGLYNGYYPYTVYDEFTSPTQEVLKKRPAPFSQKGMDVLQQLVTLCSQKNIRLFLIVAPYYNQYFPDTYITNYHDVLNQVNEVARKNAVHFLDFTSLPVSNDVSNFYNVNHMNARGARIYSVAVADSLKKIVDGLTY